MTGSDPVTKVPYLQKKKPIKSENGETWKPKKQPEPDVYFGGRLVFRTKVVWRNVTVFALLHVFAFYGVWLCLKQMWHLQFLPFIFMYGYAWLGGEGVTVGAHRLWTHKSYKARFPLRLLLVYCQTIAGENSIWTWVRDHRQHHKYTDTDADPHNATRGFFFSHMGWLMMKKHPEVLEKGKNICMEDVERDPLIRFQYKYFEYLFLVIGVVIPVTFGCVVFQQSLWHSICINMFFRYVLLLHITWSVNSVAHIYGMRPYDRNILPTETGFVSLIAYGEGWHNYHHAFPWDYKASEYGKHLNVTRSIIEYFEKIGWAYELKEASHDMMIKRIQRTGDGSHPVYGVGVTEDKDAANGVIKHKAASLEQQQVGW